MLTDVKYSLRTLLKAPAFTIVAVSTLALGIGATAAIFSMVNAVLLLPLPYTRPASLTRIYTEFPTFPNGGLRRFALSPAEYVDLREAATSWQSIDGWTSTAANISASTEPTRVAAASITGGLLSSLGASATLGRIVTPQDDQPGAPPVAVISDGLWRRAFGGDPALVGRSIVLNGSKHTVVGVMPRDFTFPPGETELTDVWVPLQIDPTKLTDRTGHNLNVLGRLKPEATLGQAQAELNLLVDRWGRASSGHHFDSKEHTLVTYALHDEVVRGVRPALQMLFGAVCFLLLIACVNVANILLARAEGRQREIAVRAALGAGVWRLGRQFLTEGAVLAGLGAAAGLLLAHAGLQFLKSTSSIDIPRTQDIGIDWRVLLFALATSLLIGLVFGLAPLVHVLRKNLHDAMKSAAVSTTGSDHTQRFRQALVVAQLALALTLLTGTGLMLRGFWELQRVDVGIDPNGITTMIIALPDEVYSGNAAQSFWTQLQQRMAGSPGIEETALSTALPPAYPANTRYVAAQIEGFAAADGESVRSIDFYQIVTQNYFKTFRIRLLAGRSFDERDGEQAPPAAIVNETMARTFWKNGTAVGHRVRPSLSNTWYTIVGVAADVKNTGVDNPTGSEIYLPYTQTPAKDFLKFAYITVRSQGDPSAAVAAVRHEVLGIDPGLPIARVRSMTEVISATQARPRFLTVVLTLFALAALILAAVGVYGVVSYTVARTTREFGVRIALGAQRGDILRLVLRRGLPLVWGGVLIGLLSSLASTRLLAGFLFGVTATDPTTFAAVSLLLFLIAIFASYLPARRAMQVDPQVAIRTD
jgi:putative ABC transport system permease protein